MSPGLVIDLPSLTVALNLLSENLPVTAVILFVQWMISKLARSERLCIAFVQRFVGGQMSFGPLPNPCDPGNVELRYNSK